MGRVSEPYGKIMEIMGKTLEKYGNNWKNMGKTQGKKMGIIWEEYGNIWKNMGKTQGKIMGKIWEIIGKILEKNGKQWKIIWEEYGKKDGKQYGSSSNVTRCFPPWRHDEAPGDDAGIAQVQELPTGGETRDIFPWKTCGTYGCL